MVRKTLGKGNIFSDIEGPNSQQIILQEGQS